MTKKPAISRPRLTDPPAHAGLLLLAGVLCSGRLAMANPAELEAAQAQRANSFNQTYRQIQANGQVTDVERQAFTGGSAAVTQAMTQQHSAFMTGLFGKTYGSDGSVTPFDPQKPRLGEDIAEMNSSSPGSGSESGSAGLVQRRTGAAPISYTAAEVVIDGSNVPKELVFSGAIKREPTGVKASPSPTLKR